MSPKIIKGNIHSDSRGTLYYNNDFDASQIKRIYFIENIDTDFIRGWQGHKIEQRWFSAVLGSFRISILPIVSFESSTQKVKPLIFELFSKQLDVLHTPGGYVTAIQALESNAKLLVMADYHLGEINDEYRFEVKSIK
ncbi:MAG: sugar epimerase [Bacteroidota bacterium]|nr:sugar epimerase [Bacteroidota bacterium]